MYIYIIYNYINIHIYIYMFVYIVYNLYFRIYIYIYIWNVYANRVHTGSHAHLVFATGSETERVVVHVFDNKHVIMKLMPC